MPELGMYQQIKINRTGQKIAREKGKWSQFRACFELTDLSDKYEDNGEGNQLDNFVEYKICMQTSLNTAPSATRAGNQ